MGRRTLIALFLAAACSSYEPKSVPFPDGGQPCTAGSHSCAGGTRCVNSFCVATCTNGAACPAGMFCPGPSAPDDVCAAVEAQTCSSASPCPFGQSCLFGHCTSVQLVGDGGVELCNPDAGQDKCAPDAICYVVSSGPRCLGLPSCGQDGGCPTGAISHACNLQPDGGHIISGKAPICALQECALNSDCIDTAVCFHGSNVPWGSCQYGIVNDRCFTNADCPAALACRGPDGGPGDGGVPGTCCVADAGVACP
jgi:hypothetical protein